jgi:hypothetical protein
MVVLYLDFYHNLLENIAWMLGILLGVNERITSVFLCHFRGRRRLIPNIIPTRGEENAR